MSNSILLLSQQSCRPCSLVKLFLDSQNVNYHVVDVHFEKEYIDRFNIMSTPVTILLDENGSEIERVSGYNPSELEEMISKL